MNNTSIQTKNTTYNMIPYIGKLLFIIAVTICLGLFYVKNPYKLIVDYNSIVVILTLVVAFFSFYINITTGGGEQKSDYTNVKYDILKYIILFLCYATMVFFFYSYNASGYLSDNFIIPISILISGAGLFILSYLLLYIYVNSKIKNTQLSDIDVDKNNIVKILKYFLFLSFGISISVILVQWIVTMVSHTSSSYDIVKLIINIFIILVLLAIIFKMITYGDFYKENPLVQLIINAVFYIPCILVAFIDNMLKLFGIDVRSKNGGLMPSKTDIVLLVAVIGLFACYYLYPILYNRVQKQGGNLVLNDPVHLNNESTVSTYAVMNNSTDFDYSYAISFWFYLNADGVNANHSYTTYSSILNYGGKPNVLYKGDENSIRITMNNENLEGTINNPQLQNNLVYDDNGNIIIYERDKILLQKWNNVIINVSGGTIDIFYNGELVKSKTGIIPVMRLDTLTSGQTNGINGGICSVVYFNYAITSQQIYYLYHSLKDKTPPIQSKNLI